MSRPAPLLLVLGLAAGCGTESADRAIMQPHSENVESNFELAELRWDRRPLLVFAPGEGDALTRQRQILADAADGLAERDMTVVELVGVDHGVVNGGRLRDRRLTAEDIKALRLAWGVEVDDFAVVLIGKDGTEKRRETQPVPAETLFEQIDQMPMRREEMREQKGD